MDIQHMRAAVKAAYPNSETWALRVKTMPADQIQALFIKFKKEGKIKGA